MHSENLIIVIILRFLATFMLKQNNYIYMLIYIYIYKFVTFSAMKYEYLFANVIDQAVSNYPTVLHRKLVILFDTSSYTLLVSI